MLHKTLLMCQLVCAWENLGSSFYRSFQREFLNTQNAPNQSLPPFTTGFFAGLPSIQQALPRQLQPRSLQRHGQRHVRQQQRAGHGAVPRRQRQRGLGHFHRGVREAGGQLTCQRGAAQAEKC